MKVQIIAKRSFTSPWLGAVVQDKTYICKRVIAEAYVKTGDAEIVCNEQATSRPAGGKAKRSASSRQDRALPQRKSIKPKAKKAGATSQ